jgi:group I intron endonuclease
MNNSGIYLIVNVINNKLYVGSAVDFQDRWRLHKLELNRNNHCNRHLQAAWNAYGESCFQFHAIEYTSDLLAREQYWIERLNSTNIDIGYNICAVARNRKGVKASDETREKLRQSHLGHKQSEETKAKRRVKMTGNKFNNGRKQTDEHKAAISKGLTARKHSKETLTKIAASNTGKKRSAETRERMSISAHKRWNKVDII